VRPAEAEAERVRLIAEADAAKMKIQAEAAASYGRVALDRMLIDQLPAIVKEAAQGLANANVTVLNGADGLGDVAAGLVSQGLAIFEAVRKNMVSAAPADPTEQSVNGSRPELDPSR